MNLERLLARFWPLGLIPVFLGLVYLWTGAIGRNAVLQQQIKAREQVITALVVKSAKADSFYAVDTIKLVRWKTNYVVSRDTLRLTDTVQVKAFIATADSTIKQCTQVVESCEHRVAFRDSIIVQKDSLIHDLKKKKPFLLRIGKPVLPFLGGIVTGMILTR